MSFHHKYAIIDVMIVAVIIKEDSFLFIHRIILIITVPAEMDARIGHGLISTMW